MLGRATGAELVQVWVHQQVLAERYDYQLVGIVPGHDRDVVRSGEVRRVYEALYVKVLVDSSAVLEPSMDALTEQTRALWAFLFDRSTNA